MIGLRIFWLHGGSRVTAGGLWSLSSAVFVGFSGLWWAAQDAPLPANLYTVTIVAYWTNIGMWMLWPNPLEPTRRRLDIDPNVAKWGIIVGLTTAVASGIVWMLGNHAALVQGASFSGLTVFLTAAIIRGTRLGTRALRQVVVAGFTVWVFSAVTFTGFGRLILVSLAAIPILLLSGQSRGRPIKLVMMAGVGPAIVALSAIRHNLAVERYGVTDVSGVGSIVSPLGDFARMTAYHSNGAFDFAHGSTFVTSAIFFVPRMLWPGKPDGFGSTLTSVIYPDLVSINQSVAALAHGEWYFNFGWMGVAAMVLTIGVLIRRLDHLLARARGWQIISCRQLLQLSIVLLLVCDLPNLMWVGSFGYVSRTGIRCIVVAALFLIAPKRPAPAASKLSGSSRLSGGTRLAPLP